MQATIGAQAVATFLDRTIRKMNSIIHFEIPVDNMSRAEKFYKELFGWQIDSVPELTYSLVTTTSIGENGSITPGAINGGMMQRQGEFKNPILVIHTKDIQDHLEKIDAAGGIIIRGKTPVGNMGFSAYFKDPEGNILCLWEDTK